MAGKCSASRVKLGGVWLTLEKKRSTSKNRLSHHEFMATEQFRKIPYLETCDTC